MYQHQHNARVPGPSQLTGGITIFRGAGGDSQVDRNEVARESDGLTNIVLDDFRKQVRGLEQLAGRESHSQSRLSKSGMNTGQVSPAHIEEEKNRAQKMDKGDYVVTEANPYASDVGSPRGGKAIQPQESTDLDDSRPVISHMQPKGAEETDNSPMHPIRDSNLNRNELLNHSIMVRKKPN